MSKKHPNIKAQDVVILAKLIIGDSNARLVDLASELCLSTSEVSEGIKRLQSANLLEKGKRVPLKENSKEFLVHAVKYIFPGNFGEISRGVPTAHSGPPLLKKIKSSKSDTYVWPHEDGKSRGQSLTPLYSSVPRAVLKDGELHEILALIDAIRVGRAREQKIAIKELEKKIFDE